VEVSADGDDVAEGRVSRVGEVDQAHVPLEKDGGMLS
jgi:hypothetical protein